MTKAFRDTASFGKRQEYVAIAQLLKNGYDVYQTMVDDQQIDCIVRLGGCEPPAYVDVQIKARSQRAKPVSWGVFPSVRLERPRPNYFFLFYSEPLDKYWVVPSLAISDLAYRAPARKSLSVFDIRLAQLRRRVTGEPCHEDNPDFEKFVGRFDLIRNYRTAYQTASPALVPSC